MKQGITHEQVVAKIKEALGLEAADFERPSSRPRFEVPKFELPKPGGGADMFITGRLRIPPIIASEKRLDPHRTRLSYTHVQRNPASSLDMGPPRGDTVSVTTTVDVDTSSGEAALISVSAQGRDRGYNEWMRRSAVGSLTALSRRAEPWSAEGAKGESDSGK